MLDFNTYLEEKKKKEVVKINPKKEDLYEKDHKAEDCTGSDHTKSEKKRRKEDVNDGPDVQNEQSLKPSDRFKRDAGAIAKKKLRQKEHNKYVNFLDVDEEKKPFPDKKVDKKLSSLRDKMKSKPYGFKRSDEKNRSMKISGIKDAVKRGEDPRSDTRGGAYAKRGNPPEDHRKHFTKTPLKNRPVKPAGVKNEEFENVDESRLTGANDMQSKLYAANNKSGKKMTDDEIKKQKGGKEFLDRIKAAKAKMSEGVYTGPKKGDLKGYGSKAFKEYEKNMDPKKRQALKDKATKGMKFTHESAPMGKSDGQLANTYEENAYDSAEESTKEIQKEISKETFNALKDTLVEKAFSIYERTRYAKETGKDPQTGNESKKGGTMKGSAMAAVRKNLVKSGGLMSSRKKPINPQGKKQVKGKKSDVGTGKYKKMADRKKEQANKAKKAGFKDTQSYVDTMARYGGEDNYKKGRGLGS
jgi:hypothetical protein